MVNPNDKGRRGEKQVSEIYGAYWNTRLHGKWEAHDLTVTFGDMPVIVEVKYSNVSINKIREELKRGSQRVWQRENHQDWVVIMWGKDYLELELRANAPIIYDDARPCDTEAA